MMVRAWMMDTSDEDQCQEHMTVPPQMKNLQYLEEQGVLYFKLDADNWKSEGKLNEIRKDRGYNYEDEIVCTRKKLPNYDAMLKKFFEEHLHDEEEIRFVLDGSGYFDIRNRKDEWVRIELVKGDMIILPAGIYHRFTLDTKEYIKAMRLFCGVPVWTPHNRPQEEHAARKMYVENFPAL